MWKQWTRNMECCHCSADGGWPWTRLLWYWRGRFIEALPKTSRIISVEFSINAGHIEFLIWLGTKLGWFVRWASIRCCCTCNSPMATRSWTISAKVWPSYRRISLACSSVSLIESIEFLAIVATLTFINHSAVDRVGRRWTNCTSSLAAALCSIPAILFCTSEPFLPFSDTLCPQNRVAPNCEPFKLR